ncbi:M20/M25/M40 family metallo-hydrolase [Fulvivirga sp. M361]|uniref:M20 family metallo-hydrolase n=1 Tax=Fulvivirga sp. M361 TaxID=2594266 RepID=UPI00117B207A|nr:M20 family metallo-hydrolase [Fulvivirga sp. M361]TRX62155.1 M20/M25/M40 family metallo-hydrolase [Fulvivirga sp. M361]
MEEEAIDLLKQLIEIPSFSREEEKTADLLAEFLEAHHAKVKRSGNNVWAFNKYFDATKPTILLNSHHDTVKPNQGYTKDPFQPEVVDDHLFGLGSNDAGGALVSLLATFLHFTERKDLGLNLIFAGTAEEEISGKNGIESIIPDMGKIDFALVGEPTQMKLAVAEKGLLVLDCVAQGKAGHAARNEGENAIYKAIEDIKWFETYEFDKVSGTLGEMHMSVTQVAAGSQHNVVPDQCSFVVDVRVTEAYSLEETIEIIEDHVACDVKPRSIRLQPSGIATDHPIHNVAKKLNLEKFGSPTLSDQALMPFPSVKIGPGDSARSHTADEYIYLNEVREGIKLYIEIIEALNKESGF